jgi:vancomycin resistance protein YoaR
MSQTALSDERILMESARTRQPANISAFVLLLLLGLCGTLLAQLMATPSPQVEIAGYATSLKGRTRGQRHNAELAAAALDGKTIAPGAVFSFNQTVKSWSLDEGYVKAPVSFDGELVRAYGGGVCQTSTTLYNAALLAGLPIMERHPHVFRPQYIAPGRDAAVAQPGVDLRFKNPYSWPIRIRASTSQETLEVHLWGARLPAQSVQITTQLFAETSPRRLTRRIHRPGSEAGSRYLRSPGVSGFRVATFRVFHDRGREVRRERLSDDSYPAMHRVVALATSDAP